MSIIIGEEIKKVVKERRVTVAWLAHEIGCHRTNIYRIFNSASIDTDILLRLSKVLHYNFFNLYSEAVSSENNF
jgi:plasmid maintenance system antidote protein VapI